MNCLYRPSNAGVNAGILKGGGGGGTFCYKVGVGLQKGGGCRRGCAPSCAKCGSFLSIF